MIIEDFPDNCCYKINTGAPVPNFADCIIQVEDTKILLIESEVEKVVELLVEPSEDLDIRYVGLVYHHQRFFKTFVAMNLLDSSTIGSHKIISLLHFKPKRIICLATLSRFNSLTANLVTDQLEMIYIKVNDCFRKAFQIV